VIIGAMSAHNIISHFERGTFVITPGDREDIILSALSTATDHHLHAKAITGLLLTGDLLPNEKVMQMIAKSPLPVLTTPLDSYSSASSIHSMTVKTLPGDNEKIACIQSLYEQYVNIDRLLEKVGAGGKN